MVRKFLSQFTPIRRSFIITFALLLALSSAGLLFVIIGYHVYPLHFRVMKAEETLAATCSFFAIWFISAMGLSISSNLQVVKEKAVKKKAEEDRFFAEKEEHLAVQALRKELAELFPETE